MPVGGSCQFSKMPVLQFAERFCGKQVRGKRKNELRKGLMLLGSLQVRMNGCKVVAKFGSRKKMFS